MRRILALSLAAAPAVPALAEEVQPPQILVSATGVARIEPDRATIGYTVRGEGTTSDAAVTRLRDSALRIEGGVRSVAKNADVHASDLNVAEVRPRECDANDYGTHRLSEGPCAVIGYVATMPVSVDTAQVAQAGTLTGLISRLGGTRAGISRFWLSDDAPARAAALKQALAAARTQAQMIAQGSDRVLGPLLRVQDGNYRDVSREIIVTGARSDVPPAPPPPPPPPPPPIQVSLKPAPIEITAQVTVSYALQ